MARWASSSVSLSPSPLLRAWLWMAREDCGWEEAMGRQTCRQLTDLASRKAEVQQGSGSAAEGAGSKEQF